MFMSILSMLNWRNLFKNDMEWWSHYMNEAYTCKLHARRCDLLLKDSNIPEFIRDMDEDCRNGWIELMHDYQEDAAHCIGFKDFDHYERYLRKHGCITIGNNQIVLGKGV